MKGSHALNLFAFASPLISSSPVAWHDEANRPTTFSKLERKRNWKESYLKVTGLRQIVFEKKPRVKPPPKFVLHIFSCLLFRSLSFLHRVWPTDSPTKTAQREYYKSLKHQKPRGKSPERCQKDFLATFVHNDD
jgi:hypothetical protein